MEACSDFNYSAADLFSTPVLMVKEMTSWKLHVLRPSPSKRQSVSSVSQLTTFWACSSKMYRFLLILAVASPNRLPTGHRWALLVPGLGWNFYPWVIDIPKVGQAYHNRQWFGRVVARYLNFTHFCYCFAKFLPHRAGPDSVANVVGSGFNLWVIDSLKVCHM